MNIIFLQIISCILLILLDYIYLPKAAFRFLKNIAISYLMTVFVINFVITEVQLDKISLMSQMMIFIFFVVIVREIFFSRYRYLKTNKEISTFIREDAISNAVSFNLEKTNINK